MLKINEIELDFELFDADIMEVYEAALKDVQEKTKEYNWDEGAEALRSSCESIKDCFDRIFGEGTGAKVCGEKPNFMHHMDAFEELVDEAVRQRKELDARAEKTAKKYGGNRDQRRAVKK